MGFSQIEPNPNTISGDQARFSPKRTWLTRAAAAQYVITGLSSLQLVQVQVLLVLEVAAWWWREVGLLLVLWALSCLCHIIFAEMSILFVRDLGENVGWLKYVSILVTICSVRTCKNAQESLVSCHCVCHSGIRRSYSWLWFALASKVEMQVSI